MKTIREWLEELPEPYRTQALENCNSMRLSISGLSDIVETSRIAIMSAFHWDSSPEGFHYWDELYETLN